MQSSSASTSSTLSTASSSFLEDEGPTFKYVLVGDSHVGKSSIVHRVTSQFFSSSQIPTIGVDISPTKQIKVGKKRDKLAQIQLWDTAGKEKFRFTTTNIYRGSHGIILVYDITDRTSFERLKTYWIPQVLQKYPKSTEDCKLLLVGNKVDLLEASMTSVFTTSKKDRQVSTKEAKDFAKSHNMQFMEISVKKSKDLDHMFVQSIQDILKEQMEEERQQRCHQVKSSFGSRVVTVLHLNTRHSRKSPSDTPSSNHLWNSTTPRLSNATNVQQEWDPVKTYVSRSRERNEAYSPIASPRTSPNTSIVSHDEIPIPKPIVAPLTMDTSIETHTTCDEEEDIEEVFASVKIEKEEEMPAAIQNHMTCSTPTSNTLPTLSSSPSSPTTLPIQKESPPINTKRPTSSTKKVHPQGMSTCTYDKVPSGKSLLPSIEKRNKFRFLGLNRRLRRQAS